MTYHLSRHLLINKYLVSFTPLGQIPSIMGIFLFFPTKLAASISSSILIL